MSVKVKVNNSKLHRKMSRMNRALDNAWQDTGEYFRKITPYRGGNARRRTRVNDRKIHANYAYAARLDAGWSRQAPNGMVMPSVKYFKRKLKSNIRRV